MAETIVASPIIHEVLDPAKYKEWKIRLKTYLKAQNLWDVVKPNNKKGKSKEVNGETSEKGKSAEVNDEASKQIQREVEIKKNATALHAIHISCGSDAFSVIQDTHSAKEAWKTLKAKYGTIVVPYQCRGEPFKYQDFFEAVRNIKDDWRIVEEILRKYPEQDKDIVASTHPGTGETGLHVAATAGNENIVKELVKLMPVEDLEKKGTDECTALTKALLTGRTSIVKYMVEKNEKIVRIVGGPNYLLPVFDALYYGYEGMAYYLYSKTPKQDLSLEKDFNNAAALLCWSIDAQYYDISFDMLERFPCLAITKHEYHGNPFLTLAQNPAMFRSTSTCRFNFWQQWIYNQIDKRSKYSAANDIYINVQNQEDSQTSRVNICGLLQRLPSYVSKLLGIELIRDTKYDHDRTKVVMQRMCEVIKTLDLKKLEDCLVVSALRKAIGNGMVELFDALIQANPELLRITDQDTGRNLFMLVVEHRQPKLFSSIDGLKNKQAIAVLRDSFENNLLHIAGFLPPSSQLTGTAGPALQMQRELQWFEAVESFMGNKKYTNFKNIEGKTPRECFTENHAKLVKEGEEWMKGTASSYSVVATLIVTIMFAAGFIVPGGGNDVRLLLHQKWFLVFIISDAVSLFSSTTSALMFLGILTSRYNEEAFLSSLPSKLILGLSTLFFSVATMMICYCAALYEMLQGQLWILIPIILLASVPVSLFVKLQFPLLVEIFISTYGPGIYARTARQFGCSL